MGSFSKVVIEFLWIAASFSLSPERIRSEGTGGCVRSLFSRQRSLAGKLGFARGPVMRRLGEIAAGGGQLHPGAKNAPGWREEILPSLDPRLVMVSGQSGASDPVRAYPDAGGGGGGRPSKLNVPFFPGAYISGAVVGADSSQSSAVFPRTE